MIGYASKKDIAVAVGISDNGVNYWVTTGVIPAPDKLIGKRYYYDSQTFDRIVRFAIDRLKHSRMKMKGTE